MAHGYSMILVTIVLAAMLSLAAKDLDIGMLVVCLFGLFDRLIAGPLVRLASK
jgi:hypothetical protein